LAALATRAALAAILIALATGATLHHQCFPPDAFEVLAP
jgi:hypothetical protein